jgi:benzoyl-CoA 2,3-epoxidase subunit B
MSVNYSERIPNNVGLSENRRLQWALVAWEPFYMRWWQVL